MMPRTLLTASIFAALAAGPTLAVAQQGAAVDFDALAACSITYQEIAGIYESQGDAASSASFQDTAHAYSAAALYLTERQTGDINTAFAWSTERMQAVADSLNSTAQEQTSMQSGQQSQGGNGDDGSMAVIRAWLPYCDTLSGVVTQLIATDQG